MTKPTDVISGLTAEALREVVRYEPETGKFFWLKSNNQSATVGDEAGTIEPATGYVRFTVLGRKYQAHRLAWLYVHGKWPTHQLDHKNLVRSDNRIENLREATPLGNVANRRGSKSNLSGLKGVTGKPDGKFQARIGFEYTVINLGTFETPEAAHRAYVEKAKELYGQFARGA